MGNPAILIVNLRSTAPEGREAILAARRLGYNVVLLTDKVLAHAKELLADVEVVDTYDMEAAIAGARRLAERHAIKGVVTWSDRDVELVARLGQALGLPSSTPAAAHLARNKYAMKQALAHLDGVVPRHARVRTWEELTDGVARIGLPAVLKPTGASASKGIFELRTEADLRPAFDWLQKIARPDNDPIFRYYGAEFILEEFLEGPEFSVEGWVSHGEVTIVGITDKWTTDPFHLEYQHVFPSNQPAAVQEEIRAKTALVVKTLGLDHTAFHLECKYTAAGFRLIEVAGRIGGDYITSHLIRLATGIDVYGNVIRVVTGERPRVEPRTVAYAGARFLLASAEGSLTGLKGAETALSAPEVEHFFMEMAPGAQVSLPPKSFTTQRIAAVLARHAQYHGVTEVLDRIAQSCTVVIAPNQA